MRGLIAVALNAFMAAAAYAAEIPIFDAHIHYGHDVWEAMPPEEAIATLRRAGIRHAVVSSANDDGTLMLLREAPEVIVPALSPYRNNGEMKSWLTDDSVPAYLEERLNKAGSPSASSTLMALKRNSRCSNAWWRSPESTGFTFTPIRAAAPSSAFSSSTLTHA